MVQDMIPVVEQSREGSGLEHYLDDHLIWGWREALVGIGIKAEDGDAGAAKVAEAFEEWVFSLCRNRSDEIRKSARLNVISMAEFAKEHETPRRGRPCFSRGTPS
jgi:hypothetical protein